MTVKTDYQVLAETIELGLTKKRDGTPAGLSVHPDYGVPVYVVNLCQSIQQ